MQLCSTSFPRGKSAIPRELKAHEGDLIAIRLATGSRVTVPKVPLNLGAKLLNFDSTKSCLSYLGFEIWSHPRHGLDRAPCAMDRLELKDLRRIAQCS